jgi:uncharacterized protein (TIGR02246 family)
MKYIHVKPTKCLVIFILMIIHFGCSEKRGTQETSSETQEKEQKLEEFFIKVEKAVHSGNKNTYANLFTEDGTFFIPDRPPIIGRKAIGGWYEIFYDKITHVTDTYDQQKVDIYGDIAIVRSRGTGSYIIKATQEQIPFRNKYIDILKYTDGKWLWMRHIASSFSLEPSLYDRDWENE